jgi:hypothetical protein
MYPTIITGERIQEKCDIYLGLPEDFRYNPRISQQPHKCLSLGEITAPWNNPPTIFCYSHRISLFRKILGHIQNNFTLFTHNSDGHITEEHLDIAENGNLLCWYAQNMMANHPKIKLLPIGIANSMWTHGNIAVIESCRSSLGEKRNNFYFYFSIGTNSAERTPCKTILEKKGLTFGTQAPNFMAYIQNLSSYKYAICPPGNGVDCHRIWECLYLNVIPILKRSIFTEKLKEKINCILLDKWEDFYAEPLLNEYKDPQYAMLAADIIGLTGYP